MRDVLLITSPQGIIERVNKSTTELFKQKKSELLGRSIDSIIQDPDFNHQKIYNSLLTSQDAVRKIEVNFINQQSRTIQIEFDSFIAPTEVKNFFSCVYIGREYYCQKTSRGRNSQFSSQRERTKRIEVRFYFDGFSSISQSFKQYFVVRAKTCVKISILIIQIANFIYSQSKKQL